MAYLPAARRHGGRVSVAAWPVCVRRGLRVGVTYERACHELRVGVTKVSAWRDLSVGATVGVTYASA